MRSKIFLFFLLSLLRVMPLMSGALEEKHIVIIVASYNNEKWYKWNLDSLFSQAYNNFHIFYVDDCSTDKTYQLVKNYIEEKGQAHRVTLIHNERRMGSQLPNFYSVIHTYCRNTDIVAICDGDDALSHPNVLSVINSAYGDANVWLTYGQFMEVPTQVMGFCKQYSAQVVAHNTFRECLEIPSHMRTFYAGLFKKIKIEDLMYGDDFLPMTGDMATMLPMIEMARDHFKFISEVLYLYNAHNPLSEHRINKALQYKIDVEIRSRKRYKKIQNPFDNVQGQYE